MSTAKNIIKAKNVKISIAKLIAACFVVLMHVNAYDRLGLTLNCIARFSVPFFMAITGWLSFQKRGDVYARRIPKYVILIAVASFIYFAWEVYRRKYLLHASVTEYFSETFTLKNLADFIFLGKNPFYESLWYLHALIYVFIIMICYVQFFSKSEKINYKPLYYISAAAYLIHIAFSVKAMGTGMEVNYVFLRFGVFYGLPMFSLGLFLHEYEDVIYERFRFDYLKGVLICVAAIGLSLIQFFGIGLAELPIPLIFMVVAIVLMVTKPPKTKKSNAKRINIVAGLLEISSITMYIVHKLIDKIIVAYAFEYDFFEVLKSHKVVEAFFVMGVSMIIGIIVWLIFQIINAFKRKTLHDG